MDALFDQQLSDAVRSLNAQSDPIHTLQRLVDLAPDFFEECDHVGVSLVERHAIRTPAASSERLRMLDEAQYALREGPCREAIRSESTVIVGDLATDPRWPRWGSAMVRELGVRASLSFRLFTSADHTWGALNLYSRTPRAFDADDVAHGQAIAAVAAVVLARTIEDEHLLRALGTRAEIGQATGMLMERFDLSGEAAFEVLRRISSHENTKVRDVASEIVRTKRVPVRDPGARRGQGPRRDEGPDADPR
ncbi:GAF and ANTAR domain-containing protein [Nocardioides sp. zg-1308]|uniref:GAF and ANTAR domain-containing protein n=1 Tax=Nocardioides sp. zg-1308 TaxID=2736253 RepID=UPI0015536B1F|nr:GAF and ANTAR domain-containing protein [Nocardioides sp. zg-1308]NPD04888.1 GAF and ANTAR domain-containing protein [Nocardioides sp. zg-1308]